MTDDWRGEHRIRHSVGGLESLNEGRRVTLALMHRTRRNAGVENPLRKQHSKFVREALTGPPRRGKPNNEK